MHRAFADVQELLAPGQAHLLAGLSQSELGLGLFDPDDRLVNSNTAFSEVFDLQAGPQTFSSMVRHCHATGRGIRIETDDIEVWLARAAQKRRSQAHRRFEVDLVDGRWLWAVETSLADGWLVLALVDLTSFKRQEAELRIARDAAILVSETDPLTGLASRRSIMGCLEEKVGLATSETMLTIALVDIDHFKSLNDQFGHDVGDQVLEGFGRVCAGAMRSTDRIGRVGGEEFLLIMPDARTVTARGVLERLGQRWRASSYTAFDGKRLSFSAGVVQWQPGMLAKDFYKRADECLYQAKAQGRDRIVSAG